MSVSEESELAAELQQLEHDIGMEELLQSMPEVPSARPLPEKAINDASSEPADQLSRVAAVPTAL